MTSTPRQPLILDGRAKAARDYWMQRLAGVEEPGGLPLDRQRSKVRLSPRRSVPLEFERELTGSALELCGDSDLLLYSTLSASLVTCLWRYGARRRVVFGSPTAGDSAGVVPIAVEPLVDTTFRELLVLARDAVTDAYRHQGYPLDRLADDLGVTRTQSREPFFDVVLALEGFHDPLPELANDATVIVRRAGDVLSGRIAYNHRLLHEDTVRRFAGHLATVLGSGLAQPGRAIDALEILTAEESRRLRARATGRVTATADEPDHVHGMFAAQVQRTPDAPAVCDGPRSLSYRELNEKVAALAGAATAKGARSGDVVAVCLEPSTDLVAATLAVLTLGAACLPVDPGLPRARVERMLADARPVLAVSQPGQRALFPAGLPLTAPDDAVTSRAAPLVSGVAGDAAAYILFTSGSTGRPKGVQMPHRALANLVRWQRRSSGPEISAGRTLLRSAASFDVSFQELFSTLCFGGTAVIAHADARRDAAELATLLADGGVQRVFLPFVALQLLVREAIARELRLPDLREVITAGEQLKTTPAIVEFFRRHPACSLHNQYGPTESHVVTAHTLSGPPTQWEPLPPIGTPIDNVSVLVLDERRQPVPAGVTGQIFIGGVAVADGYVNQPALTAERFGTGPGEMRLFRTGDLARVRGDGEIEYLGRDDRQVKIRGFRVELEEIEAMLLAHTGVAQAAAVGSVDEEGVTRLDAYVVPAAVTGESELRAHLAERLPEYMLPRSISILDGLPLTRTGKVDYRALSARDRTQGSEARALVAPRNQAETVLCQIWADVLELGQVSVTDDFLDVGGDSILATQAVALAAERGLHLKVRDFFLHPTIAELAAIAPREARARAARGPDERPAPLTPVQRWFFDLDVPSPDRWNITVLLTVEAALDSEHLERALVALAEHHEALRFTFASGAQTPIPARQAVGVRAADLSGTPAEDLEPAIARATEQLQESIDIEQGPLLAGASIRLADGRPSRLLLVAHHLVTDGVSWRILLHDLQTAYGQSARGEAIELPARTTSYQEWATQLERHAQTDGVRSELSHWVSVHSAEPGPLPRDRSAGPGSERTSRRRQFSLTADDTAAMLREVPSAYRAGVDEILLSALLSAFHDWTGERSLVIELEGHGREEILEDVDLSRTVGWFSTMFPVALTMPADDAPGAVVRAVKQRVRDVPNRGIGHGMLMWLSDDDAVREALAGRPRPEVRFNYLGRFDGLFGSSSMFRPAPEPIARMVDPNGLRPALISVQGQIVQGRLTMTLDYSDDCHADATIARLAHAFDAALVRIVREAGSASETALTPADFPNARLDASELAAVIGELGEPRRDAV